MKARLLMMALGLFWLAPAFAQSNDAPVRLALVAETPEAEPAVDLLTAELSTNRQIALLERDAIEKVYREQGLSAVNRDRLKLGRILGADGLLLLETTKSGTNQLLTARLIAVKPGVVIGNVRSPWPVAETTQWAKWISVHFGPLFPKLDVLVKDAAPISVVNLRSAIQSTEAQEDERQLTALTIERLTQERRVFVLERRRMELMSGEKELKGEDESAFWDGSYLLDGVIDRNGYSKETMTINARLTPPKGGAPVAIEIRGSRTNLADLVNQLSEKVTRVLNLGPGTAWNPADEAEQYFDEANWAMRWGMLSEGQAAIESSWALGKQTMEAAELRIRIYNAEATPDWDTYFLSPSPQNSASAAAKLQPAITALHDYEDVFQLFAAPDFKLDITWYALGITMLNSDSELLQEFYYYGQQSAMEHEEELTELRALMRDTAEMMNGREFSGALKKREDTFFLNTRNERRSADFFLAFDLGTLKAADGALWCDTPEQCLEMHREFVRSGAFERLFKYMPYQEIIAWKPEDRSRIPGLWHGFIQEVCASTNAMTKVGGYYLDLADCKPDLYRDRALRLFQVMAENAYAIVSAKRADSVIQDIEDLLGSSPSGTTDWTLYQEVDHYYDTTFKAEFNFEAVLGYLENDDRFNSGQLVDYTDPSRSGRPFNPEQARRLLTALDDYKARLMREQNEHAFRYDFNNLNYVERMANAALPKPVIAAYTATNGTETATHPVDALPQTGTAARLFRPNWPGAPQPVSLHGASTNILRITRFWDFPPGWVDDDYDNIPANNIGECRFREGRFWLEVSNPSIQVFLHKAFIYGVDLTTFQTEVIDLPLVRSVMDVGGEHQESFSTGNSFEVLDGYVYLNLPGGVQRYSLQTKTWEDLKVPLAGSLTVVGGHLFSITKDSIMELNDDGKGIRVLASARRRPAANQLDAQGNFGDLFPGPNGALRTLIGNKVYTQARGENDWAETTAVPENLEPLSMSIFDGGITATYAFSQWDSEWFSLANEQASLKPLLLEKTTPRNAYMFPNQYASLKHDDETKFAWKHPRDISLKEAPLALESGDLYFFSGNLELESRGEGAGKLREQDGRHALLLEFKRDMPEACIVPLWFELRDGLISPEQLSKLLGEQIPTADGMLITHNPGAIIFQATPQGFVITGAHLPGFWLLPWSDLNPRMGEIEAEQSARQKAQSLDLDKQWAGLLNRYHLDHRDNFTAREKEAMIDDPDFLKLELPEIDTNQNEQLDPGELAFFNANGDGVLDPREMAGIQQAWNLLAAKVMSELDRNGDGVLDSSELPGRFQTDTRSSFVFPNNWLQMHLFAPRSATNAVTLTDLQALQKSVTESLLMQGRPRTRPELPPDFAQLDASNRLQVVRDMMNKSRHPDFTNLLQDYWKRQKAATSAAPGTPSSSQ